MVSKVENSAFLGKGKPEEVRECGGSGEAASFVIPLILREEDEILEGRGKRLHFIEPSLLSEAELKGMAKKAHFCAKLVIQGDRQVFKVDARLQGLGYEEIDYEAFFRGRAVYALLRRDEVEELEGEELEEVEALVDETLLQAAKKGNKKEASPRSRWEGDRGGAFLEASSFFGGGGAAGFSRASLNERGRRRRAASERRLDERAIRACRARREAEKRREGRWKLRQRFFERRDLDRFERVCEARRAR